MSNVVFGAYYDEIDMDIGLTPYSVVDNTKEYGFKDYKEALEKLGYFESKVSDD